MDKTLCSRCNEITQVKYILQVGMKMMCCLCPKCYGYFWIMQFDGNTKDIKGVEII